MNPQDFFNMFLSNAINQSIYNFESQKGRLLPEEQADEQEKMFRAIHDFSEAAKKILLEYRQQVGDACIVKIATELGWRNGGIQ